MRSPLGEVHLHNEKKNIPKHWKTANFLSTKSSGQVKVDLTPSQIDLKRGEKIPAHQCVLSDNVEIPHYLPPPKKRWGGGEENWKAQTPSCTLRIVNRVPCSLPACPTYGVWIQKTPFCKSNHSGRPLYLHRCRDGPQWSHQHRLSCHTISHAHALANTKNGHVACNHLFLCVRMHRPVAKLSWVMHSFHPPVPGRSREGDEWLALIWIFKLFITAEFWDPRHGEGHKGAGWDWIKPCMDFMVC